MMKYWIGFVPKRCSLCKQLITDCFIDGQTIWNTWAIMCEKCHAAGGIGFGDSKGQLYRRRKDGRFFKDA